MTATPPAAPLPPIGAGVDLDRAEAQDALFRLIGVLERRGYRFVAPTPASHARVIARPGREQARTLEDVLGWSLPFGAGTLPAEVETLLEAAGVLSREGELKRAAIRVSSLRGRLYLHSAYPTEAEDAVFFGPDSYRFADLIAAEMERRPPGVGARIVDIGAGAGVGGIVAGLANPGAEVVLTDINPKALAMARVNARAAGVAVRLTEGAGIEGVEGPIDRAVINPPYIIDDAGRAYRDGGGLHGGQIGLEMAEAAAARLVPGGAVILYTGSAITGGEDRLQQALAEAAQRHGCSLRYREIDPDVFGEELEKPQYSEVDRIALVAAVIER